MQQHAERRCSGAGQAHSTVQNCWYGCQMGPTSQEYGLHARERLLPAICIQLVWEQLRGGLSSGIGCCCSSCAAAAPAAGLYLHMDSRPPAVEDTDGGGSVTLWVTQVTWGSDIRLGPVHSYSTL